MTGINWRDAKTDPPTEADKDAGGCVAIPNRCTVFGVSRYHNPLGKWCPVLEVKALIESTLNPSESQPESPWVYAPLPGESDEEAAKHGRRWPTEEDGEYVLWMCDEYTSPIVSMIDSFGQGISDENRNLRWMRIPPCPPPPSPKRELPAVAPETFPAFVTLRNGEHGIVIGVEGSTILGGIKDFRNGLEEALWYKDTGYCLSNGEIHKYDIVHVGGWLSKEELEAKRNGN